MAAGVMDYDLNQYPYPSQRRLLLGRNGAVATSQPLATLAGMEMFLAGGNAVDAAIASAIALTVVEPTSNGIGGQRAPRAGEIWGSLIHGSTLREIAATGGESFYRGKLAEAIALFAAKTAGKLTQSDLACHQSLWVEPIVTTYNGLEVWEIPPNGQGIAALMALNILESVNLASYPRDSVESFHFQIEAMKLAFADASNRYRFT